MNARGSDQPQGLWASVYSTLLCELAGANAIGNDAFSFRGLDGGSIFGTNGEPAECPKGLWEGNDGEESIFWANGLNGEGQKKGYT